MNFQSQNIYFTRNVSKTFANNVKYNHNDCDESARTCSLKVTLLYAHNTIPFQQCNSHALFNQTLLQLRLGEAGGGSSTANIDKT